jgi:hypothetical protein
MRGQEIGSRTNPYAAFARSEQVAAQKAISC